MTTICWFYNHSLCHYYALLFFVKLRCVPSYDAKQYVLARFYLFVYYQHQRKINVLICIKFFTRCVY